MKSNPTVEVVLIHYKRPGNIKPILTRFKEQTYPCTITLVDHGRDLDQETYKLVDNVYTLSNNYGCYSRFVPMGNYRHDFTYFHDDDMLPGVDLIRHFTTSAINRPEGALFGQVGKYGRGSYSPINVKAVKNFYRPVDMVVRGYFVRTRYLYTLLRLHNYFKYQVSEDDILLAWAVRIYTNKRVFLTPKLNSSSEMMNEQELPALHASSDRPEHYKIRDNFWRECEAIHKRIQEKRRKNAKNLESDKS